MFSTVLLLAAASFGASLGTFGGRMVSGPNQDPSRHWIYILSNKGNIRRVDVSHATINYGSGFPKRNRRPDTATALQDGARVHVLASQDSEGEWKATRVVIDAPGQ